MFNLCWYIQFISERGLHYNCLTFICFVCSQHNTKNNDIWLQICKMFRGKSYISNVVTAVQVFFKWHLPVLGDGCQNSNIPGFNPSWGPMIEVLKNDKYIFNILKIYFRPHCLYDLPRRNRAGLPLFPAMGTYQNTIVSIGIYLLLSWCFFFFFKHFI